MNLIRSRLREPSTWVGGAVLFYLFAGPDARGDGNDILAYFSAHRDEIAGALGALGILLGEKGGGT